MTTDILIRYFHHLGVFIVFAAVLGQHLLLRGTVSRAIVAKAQRFDIAYAVAVVVVLGTGFLQWFSGAKPAVFYTSNPVFHTKLTLFLIIGLVSIYPSIYMGRQKKGDPDDLVPIPKGLVHCLRLELLLLVLMPLLAVIMSKGVGIPVLKP